jgi:hypothetical protein
MGFSILDIIYYLINGQSGMIGYAIKSILKKLALDATTNKIRKVFAPDMEKKDLQLKLFGINDNLAVLRSNGLWVPVHSDRNILPIKEPVYNMEGLKSLASSFDKVCFNELRSDQKMIKGDFNILSIGGKSVNKLSTKIVQAQEYLLRYKFVDIEQVSEKFRPEHEKFIERKFKDFKGNIYKKPEPEKQKFLVDIIDPERSPIGPVIDDDNNLVEDVLLITVLPTKEGKRKIIVRPGYGAASKISDILNSYGFLKQIYDEIIKRNPFCYFQAVFKVTVHVDEETENYSKPDLFEIEPLKYF